MNFEMKQFLAWPIPGVGIDDPEALYCPIFSAHAYLLGKKEHLMIVPRYESDPIKLAEPAFRKIYLETCPLSLGLRNIEFLKKIRFCDNF